MCGVRLALYFTDLDDNLVVFNSEKAEEIQAAFDSFP